MTAAEIMDALRKRWPDSEYVHVPEAPLDSGRQGRKVDLLVISMWSSRGHERDAVEIKVSMSDFRKELSTPEKADFWWAHTHRFWVAVPEALGDKVKAELPTTWGLLVVSDTGIARIKVKAPVNAAAKPLPMQTVVGVIRAAEDAGPSALIRAEQRGREQGYKEGRAAAERDGITRGQSALMDEWRAEVAKFTELTGATPGELHGAWGTKYAQVIKFLTAWGHNPAQLQAQLDRAIEATRSTQRELTEIREEVTSAFSGSLASGE